MKKHNFDIESRRGFMVESVSSNYYPDQVRMGSVQRGMTTIFKTVDLMDEIITESTGVFFAHSRSLTGYQLRRAANYIDQWANALTQFRALKEPIAITEFFADLRNLFTTVDEYLNFHYQGDEDKDGCLQN